RRAVGRPGPGPQEGAGLQRPDRPAGRQPGLQGAAPERRQAGRRPPHRRGPARPGPEPLPGPLPAPAPELPAGALGHAHRAARSRGRPLRLGGPAQGMTSVATGWSRRRLNHLDVVLLALYWVASGYLWQGLGTL